jgi:hypothetical protein
VALFGGWAKVGKLLLHKGTKIVMEEPSPEDLTFGRWV